MFNKIIIVLSFFDYFVSISARIRLYFSATDRLQILAAEEAFEV